MKCRRSWTNKNMVPQALRRNAWTCTIILVLFAPCAISQADVIYVRDRLSGMGDGESWKTSFEYLQDALDSAASGDVIQVYNGTYYPDEDYDGDVTNNDQSETFDLQPGITIKGGYDLVCSSNPSSNCDNKGVGQYCDFFQGTCQEERNLFCSGGTNAGRPCEVSGDCPSGSCPSTPTILSGDIKQTGSDKSYHVVTMNTEVGAGETAPVLDALVIVDGDASGSGALENQGGAILIRDLSVKYCYGGSNPGADCTSSGTCSDDATCESGTCDGGFHDGKSCVADSECSSCKPELCFAGGVTVTGCIIRDNHASNHAAVNDHGSESSYANCVFHNNDAAKGAALLVDSGDPSISDCLFRDNATDAVPHEGGAVWLGGRTGFPGCPTATNDLTVSDCVFDSNTAGDSSSEDSEGGAFWSNRHFTLEDSTFTDNRAIVKNEYGPEDAGGALWMKAPDEDTDTSITGCTFTGNDAFNFGGAIYITGESGTIAKPQITDCTFTENTVYANGEGLTGYYGGGGAIYSVYAGATIEGCEFERNDNTSIKYGGAIYTDNGSNLIVRRCKFIDNDSLLGGAVFEESSTTKHENNEYRGNTASSNAASNGGAIYLAGTTIEIVNCTLVDNDAEADTGGIWFTSSGNDITVTNTILWGNTDSNTSCSGTCDLVRLKQIADEGSNTLTVTYSDIEDDAADSSHHAGIGNIDDDPDFIDDNPTGGLDLRLDKNSPCVNVGSNTGIDDCDLDLDGDDRIWADGTVDMGAYESYWCYSPSDCGIFDACALVGCSGNICIWFSVPNDGDSCNGGSGTCCAGLCISGTCCYDDTDCSGSDTCCLPEHECQ